VLISFLFATVELQQLSFHPQNGATIISTNDGDLLFSIATTEDVFGYPIITVAFPNNNLYGTVSLPFTIININNAVDYSVDLSLMQSCLAKVTYSLYNSPGVNLITSVELTTFAVPCSSSRIIVPYSETCDRPNLLSTYAVCNDEPSLALIHHNYNMKSFLEGDGYFVAIETPLYNQAICFQDVSFIDLTPPIILCPSDRTVTVSRRGACQWQGTTGSPKIQDNCQNYFPAVPNTFVEGSRDQYENIAFHARKCPALTTLGRENYLHYKEFEAHERFIPVDAKKDVKYIKFPSGPYTVGIHAISYFAADQNCNLAQCIQILTVLSNEDNASCVAEGG